MASPPAAGQKRNSTALNISAMLNPDNSNTNGQQNTKTDLVNGTSNVPFPSNTQNPMHSIPVSPTSLPVSKNTEANGNSKRLPLRKRIAKETHSAQPILKWQPVETPDRTHSGQSYPTSIPQKIEIIPMNTAILSRTVEYPPTPNSLSSSSSSSSTGNTTSTFAWQASQSTPVNELKTLPTNDGHLNDSIDRTNIQEAEENGHYNGVMNSRLPNSEQFSPKEHNDAIHNNPENVSPGQPTNQITPNIIKMKPLKKVQHWITKGKVGTTVDSQPMPPTATNVGTTLIWKHENPSEQVYHSEHTKTVSGVSRTASWEDERPAKKLKKAKLNQSQSEKAIKPSVAAQSPSSYSHAEPVRQVLKPDQPVPGMRIGRQSMSVSDDTLYCICRKPYDAPRFMIACDRCDQWFHGECVGISEKQGEFIDVYFCSDCVKVTGKKPSWKPKCANPACQKAARMGTHQKHYSKYCTDDCGMQIARSKLNMAEMKRRAAGGMVSPLNETRNNYLSKSRLSSFADRDDRQRLSRVWNEKNRAKAMVALVERKSTLLQALTKLSAESDEDLCGFDSRLGWPDNIWEQVQQVIENGRTIELKFAEEADPKPYTVCRAGRRCHKHSGWQKLKVLEFEQERSEQFTVLTMLERERQQIKARMNKRREEIDVMEGLANGTICHQ
ncbi:hypothetical protein EC973_009395 [Apophysomyces ossiformis]|uniref:PHD-type domain-containing protein n=1 Tax=Apophysomyces ossiformis TaxID=679940 RepID=A0A8H7BSI3_9FUNG|nr:hypothetical protein EC973_009395 [Apophysomyces ossiformis]